MQSGDWTERVILQGQLSLTLSLFLTQINLQAGPLTTPVGRECVHFIFFRLLIFHLDYPPLNRV